MIKPEYLDAIAKSLYEPSEEPFCGEEATAKRIARDFFLDIEPSAPDSLNGKYILCRILAYLLAQNGLTYTEIGAPTPLSKVTLIEHIELNSWKKAYLDKVMKRGSR